MEKILYDSLKQLGLSLKEIKFFQICFKIGPASTHEIAKVAKIERSTAYLIADHLLKAGLLKQDLKHYKRNLHTIEPQKLYQLIASKQRQLRRQELELEENLPQLQALYRASEIHPKVQLFQGRLGLIKIWQDILSAKSEILLWTNQESENLIFTPTQHQAFITQRIKKQLHIRVLAVNNQKAQLLKQFDTTSLRQTKLLPHDITFNTETYIYDSKVAILDYNKDIIGILIESVPITQSHKAIFDLTWNKL